jgi:predicted nuclease of predicted toxin-antitoxin system
MRFLADENLERSIVETLRERGHDVASAASGGAGAPDPEVLDRALAENRILVTNDKDFAELTFLQQKSAAGIILIRLPRLHGSDKTLRVVEVVDTQAERLLGVFTVIEPEAIRRRPFLTLRRRDS